MNQTDTREIAIIGHFPPPIDGQTLATQRLETLLAAHYFVHRLNTSAPEGENVAAEVKFRPERVFHYLLRLPDIYRGLKHLPNTTILWTSISPAKLGHWRDLFATVPALRKSQRVFGVLHRSSFEQLFRSSITRPTAQFLVRRLDGFVFLDEKLAEACAHWIPKEKRFVIPNTIDGEVCCTAKEVQEKQINRSEGKTLRLLFLSNMIKEKGYMDVLEAVRMLRDRNVPLLATFVGRWVDEKDRVTFDSFLDEHSLREQVEYRGSLHGRKAIKHLHLNSDVFLLPSYYPPEAQPLALLEALNAGTPTITTRHGGIPRIVRDGKETLFVPIRSPAAIADAVEALTDFTEWKRLSDGARKRFEEKYGTDAVRERWLDLIES